RPCRRGRSSRDGARAGAPPLPPRSRYCAASTVVVGPAGDVYAAYMDYQQDRLVVRKSTDHGVSFSPEFPIAAPLENFGARPPGWVVPISSDPQRYNPYHVWGSYYYAPNYPRLAVDVGPGATRGRLYAVWAERAAGTVAPANAVVFELEPNNTVATAQVVSINTDVVGEVLHNSDNPDQDLFAFDGVAGQSI